MQNTRIFSGVIVGIERWKPQLSIVKLYDIYDIMRRPPMDIRFYQYVPKSFEMRVVDMIETAFISETSHRIAELEQEIRGANFMIRIKLGADLIDRILSGKGF